MKIEQVIIVGAGPAGLAAAIQLRRYGLHPLIFERTAMGGLLRNANLVENYPGFPGGISGLELVELFSQQAKNLDIDITYEEVIHIDYEGGIFTVETERKSYQSQTMVIATGTKPLCFKGLEIPEELKHRVYYEVYELLALEGKRVAVAGSGDAAFDYGLNLSKKNEVIILNRGDRPKCLPLLWERYRQTPSMVYHDHILMCQLRKDPDRGFWLDCQSKAGEIQFHVDYLLGAIGREACLDCLSEAFRQQAQALVEQGVLYMIGDVKNGIYRQTSIAVGDGVLAAMKIYELLKEAIT